MSYVLEHGEPTVVPKIEKPLCDDSGLNELGEFEQNLQYLKQSDLKHSGHPVIKAFGNPKFNTFLVVEASLEPEGTTLHGISTSNWLALPACPSGNDTPGNYCLINEDGDTVWVRNDPTSKHGFVTANLSAKPGYTFIVCDVEVFFKLAACRMPAVLVPHCPQGMVLSQSLNFSLKAAIQRLEGQGLTVYVPVLAHEVSTYTLILSDTRARIMVLPCDIDQNTDEALLARELKILKQKVDQQADTAEWGDLKPIQEVGDVTENPYPVEAFGNPILINAIRKSAHYHNVALAVAGQTFLGEMAFVAQNVINAPSDNSKFGQPCSLFMLTVYPSGEGKDVCKNDASKISKALDAKNRREFKAAVASYDPASKEPPPLNPKTRFKKASVQGILRMMSRGASDSFIWSTGEGGYLLGGYSLKSDTVGEAVSVVNDLVDTGAGDSTLKNDDDSNDFDNKRFTLDIAVQDVVARPALYNELLREQGFLARVLFAAPEPLPHRKVTVASRKVKSYQDADLQAYWSLCEQKLGVDSLYSNPFIYRGDDERPVISKSDEAEQIHVDYENFIGREVEAGGKYQIIRAYAKRTRQYILRVAAVLAFWNDELVISGQTMRNAVMLCKYSLDEWIRYYSEPIPSDAELLLKWLLERSKKHGSRTAKSSICQNFRLLKGKTRQRDEALAYLIEANQVRIELMGKAEYIVLNPALLKSV